jgi:4-carboxymuconolactone decarboxylase
MSERDNLRAKGAKTRTQIGLNQDDGDALLPGYEALADEVIFGRVWARDGLARTDRMLATLCALTCKQYLPQLERYAGAALDLGLAPRTLQEVMLHCAMYAGLPSAENALSTLHVVFKARNLEVPTDSWARVDLETLNTQGNNTMRDLHQERADGGYAAPESAAAALYGTAIQYLYGEIWNRPGITRHERMVCSVAAFTALQMKSQQRKFFRSALNVGLSATEVMEIIIQTGPYSGFPSALNALVVAEEVLR